MGVSASRTPRDLAAVVPYRDGRTDIYTSGVELRQNSRQNEDEEVGDLKLSVSQTGEYRPIIPESTPFFHVDLQSAVRAAESGAGRFSDSA